MGQAYEKHPGPIEDLRLPLRVWNVLRRENIRNLDHLKAVAGRIDRFDEIGPTMARIVRQEITRTVWSGLG
jgi:hypothetical protein